jgi:hypothetical protein
MAAVPQLAMFADQLPLMLVARTRVEAMTLALLSHVGGVLWIKTQAPGAHPSANAALFVLASVYYPALVLVLRRPNDGSLRAWLGALLPKQDASGAAP